MMPIHDAALKTYKAIIRERLDREGIVYVRALDEDRARTLALAEDAAVIWDSGTKSDQEIRTISEVADDVLGRVPL